MKGGNYAQILTKIKKCTGLCMEMLVSIRMGTNIAFGNQQKHLLLSVATKARFQVIVFLIQ